MTSTNLNPFASKAPQAGNALTSIGQERAAQEVQAAVLMAKRFPRDQHAGMSEFAKASARFRYHVSDAFYSKGMAAIHDGLYFHYWFLVVETEPPHGVAIYELDQDSKRLGAVIAKHDLALIKQCMVDDDCPAYPEGARVISLPKWAEFTNII